MEHDWISRSDALEYFERSAAIDHEIFGNDLEPIDFRRCFEDVGVMRATKPDTEAEEGEVSRAHHYLLRTDKELVTRLTFADERLLHAGQRLRLATLGGAFLVGRGGDPALAFAAIVPHAIVAAAGT